MLFEIPVCFLVMHQGHVTCLSLPCFRAKWGSSLSPCPGMASRWIINCSSAPPALALTPFYIISDCSSSTPPALPLAAFGWIIDCSSTPPVLPLAAFRTFIDSSTRPFSFPSTPFWGAGYAGSSTDSSIHRLIDSPALVPKWDGSIAICSHRLASSR